MKAAKNNGRSTNGKLVGGCTGKGFKPGKSGNANGRPPIPEDVKEAARALTVEALDTLRECLRDKSGAVRVRAAEALLDRAWGKAPAVLDESNPYEPQEIRVVFERDWFGQKRIPAAVETEGAPAP